MIRFVKKIIIQILATANVVTILVMLIAGYADRLEPTVHPTLANMGLLLPVLLIMNVGFLVTWVIFHFKNCWIPIVGFVLCFPPIRNYCPLNLPKEAPPHVIKVLSYNVWYFAGWKDKGKANPILTYLRAQDADIVCLQEAETTEVGKERIEAALNPIYAYRDFSLTEKGSDRMAIYSKFPILKKEAIHYPSEGNHSTAFFLDIKGDTVIVINNHLESIGLTEEDKDSFKGMVKGKLETDSIKIGSKSLYHKLAKATKIRAPQAKAVAQYIEQHQDKTIILCGDFNDGPNSFARRTIAKHLCDCYIETGNGPGISYHLGGFYVRIDQLMCSKNLKPYHCQVDNKIKTSDHYPIYCWLEKQAK